MSERHRLGRGRGGAWWETVHDDGYVSEPEWVPDSAARCSGRWWDTPLAVVGVLCSLFLSCAVVYALLLVLA